MAIIGPDTPISLRPHYVRLQRPYPVPPITDGDGGFVENWIDLVPPQVFARIEPATAQQMEHFRANTIVASATHVIAGPWHPMISTYCRVRFGSRTFQVVGVANRGERHVEMILACVELVPAQPTAVPNVPQAPLSADGHVLRTDEGDPLLCTATTEVTRR